MKSKLLFWVYLIPGFVLAGGTQPVGKDKLPAEEMNPKVQEQALPQTIIVKVKAVQQGEETEATVQSSTFQQKVTNAELAKQANAALQDSEQINLAEQSSYAVPKEVQNIFEIQELVAMDPLRSIANSAATDTRFHWNYFGNRGLYGYGYRGHYGYGYHYPYRHANYGYWWGNRYFPYVNYGYYYPYGGYNYYYYHNPYYY